MTIFPDGAQHLHILSMSSQLSAKKESFNPQCTWCIWFLKLQNQITERQISGWLKLRRWVDTTLDFLFSELGESGRVNHILYAQFHSCQHSLMVHYHVLLQESQISNTDWKFGKKITSELHQKSNSESGLVGILCLKGRIHVFPISSALTRDIPFRHICNGLPRIQLRNINLRICDGITPRIIPICPTSDKDSVRNYAARKFLPGADHWRPTHEGLGPGIIHNGALYP